jgi:predicted dehydrogenase
MAGRIRVGVVGVGRSWHAHYRPALAALQDRFRVVAVADPNLVRADRAARVLKCEAPAAVTDLVRRNDVDAVLAVGSPWYRLWPLEVAVRAGKPIFCGCPGATVDPRLGPLVALALEAGVTTGAALMHRLAPVFLRLAELCRGELGPARLLVAEWVRPAGSPDDGWAGGASVIDACLELFGGPPDRTAIGGAGPAQELAMSWADGRAAKMYAWRSPRLRKQSLRWRVVAKHGEATAVWPDRVAWTRPDGRQAQRLRRPGRLVEELLRRFHEAAVARRPPAPGLADVERAVGCLPRAAPDAPAKGWTHASATDTGSG